MVICKKVFSLLMVSFFTINGSEQYLSFHFVDKTGRRININMELKEKYTKEDSVLLINLLLQFGIKDTKNRWLSYSEENMYPYFVLPPCPKCEVPYLSLVHLWDHYNQAHLSD